MIKGGSEEDAVLCTSDRTYNVRSVTLSNSVLVLSPTPHIDGSEDQVVIQDSLNELLELVPAVPKLHRMNVLLQEHVWEEGHEDFRAVRHLARSHNQQWLGLERNSPRRSDSPSKTPGWNFRPASKRSRERSRRGIYSSLTVSPPPPLPPSRVSY